MCVRRSAESAVQHSILSWQIYPELNIQGVNPDRSCNLIWLKYKGWGEFHFQTEKPWMVNIIAESLLQSEYVAMTIRKAELTETINNVGPFRLNCVCTPYKHDPK